MKKILFCSLFLSIAFFTKAQEINLTPKEKNAVEIVKTTLFLQNIHGPIYLDKYDYEFHRDDEGKLLMSAKNSNTNAAILGDKYSKYKISITDQGRGLIELFKRCDRTGFIRLDKWNGNKVIATASRTLKDGKLIYDANNKIIAVDLGRSYKRSGNKKIGQDMTIKIGYDSEGRLSSVHKEVLLYKKSKSSKDLQEDYTYKEYEYSLEYGDNKIIYNMEKYALVDGKPQKIEHKTQKINQNGLMTIDESVTTTYKKSKETKYNTLNKIQYDDEMKILNSYQKDHFGEKTIIYSYDPNDNIIEENLRIVSTTSKVKEELLKRKFNQYGLVTEAQKIKKEDANLIGREVTTYIYSPLESNTEITSCAYKKEYSIDYYDNKEELFKESKNGKFRVKENGVWSDWKFGAM